MGLNNAKGLQLLVKVDVYEYFLCNLLVQVWPCRVDEVLCHIMGLVEALILN